MFACEWNMMLGLELLTWMQDEKIGLESIVYLLEEYVYK